LHIYLFERKIAQWWQGTAKHCTVVGLLVNPWQKK
jgi:hypothetical protein